MEPLDQLILWEYRVEKAQEHDGFDVWFIEGFGLATYVRSDDDALASLVEGHDERVRQADETPEETMTRMQAAAEEDTT